MEQTSIVREIVARSASLAERLEAAGRPDVPAPATEEIPQLLTRWARVASGGDLMALSRRLSWQGIDPFTAAKALKAPPAAEGSWGADLERYAALTDEGKDCQAVEGAAELPFAPLWQPWVHVAREPVEGLLAAASSLLSTTAIADLELLLLREIGTLSEMAALELLEAHRQAIGESAGAYEAFVSACLSDPLQVLYHPFPVLARQTCTVVRQWRLGLVELVSRLDSDADELATTFASGKSLGAVESIGGGLSDRHHDGRQVLRLDFENGPRLAYKPRSVEPEAALHALLEWCQEQQLEACPVAPRVLSKPGYGWIEWVEPDRFDERDEAAEYFRRAGALVAVAHALRGQDLHAENLVATLKGPVVIDAEVLFQPRREVISSGEGAHGLEAPGASCLATGLLTALLPDGRESRPFGGLRSPEKRRVERREWRDTNQDTMHCEAGVEWQPPLANAAWLSGRLVGPEDFVDEVVSGFEEAYRFLLQKRDALLAPSGPLAAYEEIPVRVLFRPSQEYGRVVALMAMPRNQKSGLAGSYLMEAMLGAFKAHEERPQTWPLIMSEQQAMMVRDIPWFSLPAAAKELSANGETVDGLFLESGLEAVASTLLQFSEEDLELQKELVRSASEPPRVEVSFADVVADPAAIAEEPISDEAWLETARGIGRVFLERPRGMEKWRDRWDLATGQPGWALFLAALGADAGSADAEAFRSEARRLCAVEDDGAPQAAIEAAIEAMPLGGFAGLGSLLWSHVWLAERLDEPSLLERAERLALTLTAERISDDRNLDLEGGAAGAVLGLLAVAEATGKECYLDSAQRCGDHLLEAQRPMSSSSAAWENAAGLAQTGLMHGAAGIARALSALAVATDRPRYAVGAAAAIAYERGLFDRNLGNWPTLVVDSRGQRRGKAWRASACRGAPGIALSRLFLAEALNDSATDAELEVALDTTASAAPGRLQTLCCGSFGRSSILLTAALRRGDADRLRQAREIGGASLAMASKQGGFVLSLDCYLNRKMHPGLLHGLSGVGYQLLRLAGARALPEVLALELMSETKERRDNEGAAVLGSRAQGEQ